MKIKSYIYSAVAILGLSLTSCGNDFEYQQGEQVDENCMTVYFTDSNDAITMMTEEEFAENPTLTVEVSRLKTDQAASIPVIVDSKDDVFTIPSTIEFAAGEATAQLIVSMSEIDAAQTHSFSIHIPSEYVNPYLELNGSDKYIGSVLIAKWVKAIQNIRNTMTNSSDEYVQADTYSDLYWLQGLNRYRITNFLGSGVDLTFELGNSSDNVYDVSNINTWHGTMDPLDHYYYRTYSWYLRDDDNNNASWKSDSNYPGINRVAIYYGYDYGYGHFWYLGPNMSGEEYGAWLRTYVSFDDGTADYCYSMLYWDEDDILIKSL
jgi:hypothetical protein